MSKLVFIAVLAGALRQCACLPVNEECVLVASRQENCITAQDYAGLVGLDVDAAVSRGVVAQLYAAELGRLLFNFVPVVHMDGHDHKCLTYEAQRILDNFYETFEMPLGCGLMQTVLDFNAVVLRDLNASETAFSGRVLTGRDAILDRTTIGGRLPWSPSLLANDSRDVDLEYGRRLYSRQGWERANGELAMLPSTGFVPEVSTRRAGAGRIRRVEKQIQAHNTRLCARPPTDHSPIEISPEGYAEIKPCSSGPTGMCTFEVAVDDLRRIRRLSYLGAGDQERLVVVNIVNNVHYTAKTGELVDFAMVGFDARRTVLNVCGAIGRLRLERSEVTGMMLAPGTHLEALRDSRIRGRTISRDLTSSGRFLVDLEEYVDPCQ